MSTAKLTSGPSSSTGTSPTGSSSSNKVMPPVNEMLQFLVTIDRSKNIYTKIVDRYVLCWVQGNAAGALEFIRGLLVNSQLLRRLRGIPAGRQRLLDGRGGGPVLAFGHGAGHDDAEIQSRGAVRGRGIPGQQPGERAGGQADCQSAEDVECGELRRGKGSWIRKLIMMISFRCPNIMATQTLMG